jgi:hypothetical protein
MCGYAAAYFHSFCMLYCVERHVDMSTEMHGETVKYEFMNFVIVGQHHDESLVLLWTMHVFPFSTADVIENIKIYVEMFLVLLVHEASMATD